MNLDGAVVLLTGASRGIGTVVARELRARGARLALVARSRSGLIRAKQELESAGGGAEVACVSMDLSEPGMAPRLRRAVEEALGPVDVLVNNAGIGPVERFEEQEPDKLLETMNTNLVGPMLLTRELVPGMIVRGRGHVVNVASLAGLTATAYCEAYCASKHGLVGFTRGLRASLKADGSGVSASSVCPGYIRDVGMFAEQVAVFGAKAPLMLGESPPESVAAAVVKAIEEDRPEVVVNPGPMRPLLALGTLWPRLSEWVAPKVGSNSVNRHIVEQ